jgi:hypothetical protein
MHRRPQMPRTPRLAAKASQSAVAHPAVAHPAVHRAVTLRALVVSALLIPVNAWWLIETEYVRYSDNGTTAALFFNAISLVLLLLLANGLLTRVRPRWRFTRGELVVIYVAVSVATNLGGHDQLQILFATITYLSRRAVPGDPWAGRLVPHVDPDLVVPRGPAVDDLYKGSSTLYRWDHVLPWMTPLAWWCAFALAVVWTLLCLTAIFRKQWEAERLTYPIAEVPIQVILHGPDLFRRPLLWAGIAIGAGGQIANFCHNVWPTFPEVPIGVQYYQFPDYPLRAAGSIPISIFPFAVGLCFLLPLQIGFSVWFFFLLARVEMVAAWLNGFTDVNGFPYIRQQGVGAALGFAALVLWNARGHLRHVVRAALGFARADDEGEPMSYRLALFGFAAGCAALGLFAVKAGMRPASAFYYFAVLLTIIFVVARLRAEVGLPTFEFFRVGAEDVLNRVAGTAAWTREDLGVMSLFYWLTRTHRQFPMQTQVDSFRLARRAGLRLSSMSGVILGASALGIACSFWALLHVMYQTGFESAKYRGPGLRAFGPEPWRWMDTLVLNPLQPDPGSTWAYAAGAVFVVALGALRARFVDWPFHPAGYLIAGSFGLFRLWLPLFTAWLLKALILRYGGLRGYQAALPFFIGLVLGEFGAGFVRTLLDLAFGLYLPPGSGIGGL